jgi:phage I-like protein
MTRIASRFLYSAVVTLGDGPSWQQILQVGAWKHPQYGDLVITAADLRELKTNFDNRVRSFVYADYDHGIANPKGDGNAITAGEVTALELRNHDAELWALYEPTAPARQKIEAKEYRFTSADFDPNYVSKRTGLAVGKVLRGFALTNRPFLEGMAPLSLGDAQGAPMLFAEYSDVPTSQEIPMSVKTKLKLAETATDAEVEAAVDKLISDAAQATTLSESHTAATTVIGTVRTTLKLDEKADVGAAVKTLADRNAELTKKDREREADATLDKAVREGKLAPAMKPTFRAQLLSDTQAVADAAKEILEKSPKIIPIGTQKADGTVDSSPTTDREKLLDEKIKTIRAEEKGISYGDALIKADRLLDDEAAARQS